MVRAKKPLLRVLPLNEPGWCSSDASTTTTSMIDDRVALDNKWDSYFVRVCGYIIPQRITCMFAPVPAPKNKIPKIRTAHPGALVHMWCTLLMNVSLLGPLGNREKFACNGQPRKGVIQSNDAIQARRRSSSSLSVKCERIIIRFPGKLAYMLSYERESRAFRRQTRHSNSN